MDDRKLVLIVAFIRTAPGIQGFDRVELDDTTLSHLAGNMSNDELEKWVNVRLPVLDEMLESGTPVDAILKPFQNGIYQAVKHDPVNKKEAIDDLRFASAYIQHQLKQPESRLRHFNPRYRDYATMLGRAASREDVIDAASRIRLENAQLGFRWDSLSEVEKAEATRPLTSKEMQYLFTEASPRHYTSEMTAARLAYLNAGDAARTKTDALMRGEIVPSNEAAQLVGSLESRMERKDLKDSLSATKHFLQSLKTPNDDLRYKNSFDHSEVYRKLPPAERDFIYQQAVLQKEKLESRIAGDDSTGRSVHSGNENMTEMATAFRSGLKAEIIGLFEEKSHADNTNLGEQIGTIVEKNLERIGSYGRDPNTFRHLGRELGERLASKETRDREPYAVNLQRDSMPAAANRQLFIDREARTR